MVLDGGVVALVRRRTSISDPVIRLVACALPSPAFRASSTTRNPRYRNFVNVREIVNEIRLIMRGDF